MDIAVVGVGARLTLDESGVIASARIALGAVAPQAFLADAAAAALLGTRGEPEALEAAATAAMEAAKPISDKRGSADFRRRICGGASEARGGPGARTLHDGRSKRMKVHVQTEVNGEAVEFLCDPTTTLLEVLGTTSAFGA